MCNNTYEILSLYPLTPFQQSMVSMVRSHINMSLMNTVPRDGMPYAGGHPYQRRRSIGGM